VLRSRPVALYGLLSAVGVSDLGSKLTFLALPWLVLSTTGSPTTMGVVSAAELLPFIVAVAVGGPLVDRVGPRRVAVLTDAGCAVVVGTVAVGYPAGTALLVPLVAVLGALTGLGRDATVVLLRPAAELAGADLTRVTSTYYGIARFNDLVFAPLGGGLVAVAGAPAALLVDAVSFAVSAVVVAMCLRPASAPPTTHPGGYLTALRDGAAFLRRDRLLTTMMAMFLVTNLCHQANTSVFVPLWVHDVLRRPAGLGVLTGAYALGGLLGSAAYTALAHRLSRYLVLTVGLLAGGAPRFLALAAGGHLPVTVAAFFGCGLAVGPILTVTAVLLYERVPGPMQARVFGAATAVSTAGLPLGVLAGGSAVDAFGLRVAVLGTGVAYVGASLVPVFGYRTWRAMDRRPAG
jgi:MFS family permease